MTAIQAILSILWLFTFFPLPTSCFAEDFQELKTITVDLQEPIYSQGILTTYKGGVVSGPGIRIQAMHIIYTRKSEDNAPVYNIKAEGNLILDFGDYVFIGDELEYDFLSKTGVIYNGRTMLEPWFIGGNTIFLCADGSYVLENAFLTTSENYLSTDWQIYAEEARLEESHLLSAKNVQLKLGETQVLCLPSFKIDLNTIFDSPVRYNVKWGSRQGHRFGLVYELFSWQQWKTFLRFDYRLKRGPGLGFEIEYESLDGNTTFQSINYVASDSSIIHPGQRIRYRYQGLGDSLIDNNKISIHFSYDKLSDIDMPTDYNDRGLDLETAGRTELIARRQEENWISNFITRLRINKFQTIKEELPTLRTSWRPFEIGHGFIADNTFKVAFLDFAYGNNLLHVHDYRSARVEFAPLIYRNYKLGCVNVTPEIGGVAIAYGNSPQGSTKWLALGRLALNVNMQFWRQTDSFRHVIIPYADYQYYTLPTISPNGHYIFDIEDGWYRLNTLRFGFSQSLYHKNNQQLVSRKIFSDIYAIAFFDTYTFHQTIPKLYADIVFNTFSFLRHSIYSGWDFMHNEIDHYNVRTEWTVSDNMAIAAEFRHRSAYDWRKADHTNFILDSYRSVNQLRHSRLSDRRDTLLFHLFYRFHPNWAIELESRHGWNRHIEPAYNEFEIDLSGKLRSTWNFRLSYQHKEDDDRISVYFNMGISRPDYAKACCDIVPNLSF